VICSNPTPAADMRSTKLVDVRNPSGPKYQTNHLNTSLVIGDAACKSKSHRRRQNLGSSDSAIGGMGCQHLKAVSSTHAFSVVCCKTTELTNGRAFEFLARLGVDAHQAQRSLVTTALEILVQQTVKD
jgi:hypothetical protein